MNMACSELTFRGTISTILLFLLCINYCRCEILSIDELEPIKNEEKQLYPTITNDKLGGNENAHKDDDDPARAVELEHEAQGGSGERFIAVPAHNLGATERLEPSLNGLGGIVSSNLPTGVRLIRVIEATREVVAGIRYDFLIEVADLESTDDPFVCHLALLERPWITTQWGDKERSVITTNCSLDATLTVTDTNVSEKDRASLKPMSSVLDVEEPESDNMENNDLAGAGPLGNVIDAKLNEKPLIDEVKTEPNFDSIADSGQVEDILEHLEDTMTPERMKDVEDQIVRKVVEDELSEPIQEQVEEDIFIEPLLTSNVQNEEQARVDDVVQEDSPQNEEIETVTESQQREETTQKEEIVVTEPVVVKKTVKIDLQRENPQSKLDALEGLKSWLDNVRIVETTTSGVLESVKTLQSEVLPHITEDKVGDVDDETVKIEKKTDNVEDATVKVDQQKIKLIDDFLGLTKKDEPDVEPRFVKVVVEKKYALDVNTGDKKDIQVKENKEETSEESDEVKGAKSSSEESNSEENTKSKVKQANSSEKSKENNVKTDSADNSDSEEDLVISYLRRRKRSAPSKELVNRLANYAVNELDHIDTDNRKRIVLDVLDARQQNKKDGTYYLLKIKIGSTDCSESSSNSQKCIKSVIKNTVKICSLEVKKNGNEERVIKSHCVPFDKKIINRSKRQVPGGVTDASADDPYIQELIAHTLSQLRGLSEDNANLNVIKVGPVSRQVVQGILVRMMLELGVGDVTQQICEVDIWDRQWLPNGREVNTTCSDTENSTPVVNSFKTSVNRGKRDVFVGGSTTVDINDSYIQELLNDMMRKLRSVSDIYSRQKVIRTFDVTRQVVSGSLVKMTIEIGEADDVEHTCQVQIWDRPWIPDGREVKAVCRENKPNALSVKHIFNSNTIRSKRSVNVGENVVPDTLTDRRNVGVGLHVEPDDPYIQELAQHTVEQLKTLPDMNPELALIRVSSVYEKRIAGNYVVMTLELGKNKDTVETFCFAKIWDRIWRKNGREVIVKCGDKDDSNVSEHVFRSTVKSAREKRSLWFKHGYKHSLTISEQEKHRAKLFNVFIDKYNKRYTTQEYKMRIKIFKHNLNVINNLNQFEKGTAKYGVTQFADLTEQEFRQYTGLLQPNSENNNAPNLVANIPDIDIPENFDWRDKGAVSGVKNQGQCGSCWAFSVTGNIEGLNAIKTGKLEEFSEQELVDCDTVDQGCNGGLPDNAYKAIEELGGLELESDYPYEAHRDSCHYNKTMSRVRVSGAVDLPADETAMAKWLVANGPISIGINANAMQFYYGGVSHPWKMLCRPGKLDHGVLIVGYGVHDYPKFNKTLPYWIVKNSWGPNWGEQGYYRVFRGDGTCGVDKMATSAVLQGN